LIIEFDSDFIEVDA